MVHTQALQNGNFVTIAVAEVTSVPYFELYDKSLDRANHMNQVLFSHLLSSIHRRSAPEQTAFELLFHSVPVTDQTYKAQVKLYLLVRTIGADRNTNERSAGDLLDAIRLDLEEQNFLLTQVCASEDFHALRASLLRTDCSCVLSVSKKERAVANALSPNGATYYNEVIEPSENVNITSLTNALTQHPNSTVSLQIIPTRYSAQELQGITAGKAFLNHYVSEIRFRHGLRVDTATQMIVDAYDYYADANNEPLFLYNFLIYARPNGATDLATRLATALESEDKATGSALDIVDVSDLALSPGQDLFASPWLNSHALIYRARNTRFWSGKTAPVHLQRLKQLMTARELRGIFKLPIDDGKLIGIQCNRLLANREKLHKSIISNDSVKVGVIQNVAMSGSAPDTHAGISLNDFTRHALIVGMPGSGKTNFSLGLLLQFWKDLNIPFLAIEPTKSEYRSLIDAIPDLQIFTPGKAHISPYIIDPFIPPKGVTVESFVPSLVSAFKAAFSMPDPLPDLFLGAINDCYNEYGWKQDSTSDDPNVQFFGLYEFIRVFKRKMQRSEYKGDVKANMESAGVVRLISLIEQNSNIYDTVHTIPLEDLLSKPTIIELNAINNKEQKSLIMALLLIMVCVHTKNNIAGDGKLKNVMLIDEAHVLLAGGAPKNDGRADAQGSTVETLEDMIAEIRSYGTSIIIADQSPQKVGNSIIANTNVKVIFKLVEKENKQAIASATDLSDADVDLLGRLGLGEALLHYGRVHAPLHIKTYDIRDRFPIRDVISDAEIAPLVTYWDTRKELLIPHRECAYNCFCTGECDFALRANADFVAARLIDQFLYDLPDKAAFAKLLVRFDRPIAAVLAQFPSIAPSVRLSNCIKIKFLRKAMLIKPFGITKADYATILNHPDFLKRGDP